MAYSVSLATLSRRALQRVNMEYAATNQFVKSGELTDHVNASIAKWVDEVRGTTWNGTYSRSSQSFTTTGNTQIYPLAADFLSLISIDVLVAGNSPVISALPYQEEQRNAFRNMPVMFGWGFAAPVYYQIQGTNLSFIPTPQGAYSVVVNYVPTSPILVLPADTIDSINGWEEFIVIDTAIKLATKAGQEKTIPLLEQRLASETQRIRALAPRRDLMAAERVHVIQNAGFDSDWDW